MIFDKSAARFSSDYHPERAGPIDAFAVRRSAFTVRRSPAQSGHR
jgi:hypothetical protein